VKAYRYYDLILGAYVCVVLCANLIGAAKVATVHVPLWGPITLMSVVIVHLPPADFWRPQQPAVEAMFGNTPRIACGSMVAFWCGSFVNSYVLAKMKLLTSGRWLWTRTIGSTLCGELVDSALFYTIAFAGLWPRSDLIAVTVTQYVLKSAWEVIATPATYWIVGFLKRAEHEDYYDRNTDFTPFSLRA
jgi:queuosine precursor transporter